MKAGGLEGAIRQLAEAVYDRDCRGATVTGDLGGGKTRLLETVVEALGGDLPMLKVHLTPSTSADWHRQASRLQDALETSLNCAVEEVPAMLERSPRLVVVDELPPPAPAGGDPLAGELLLLIPLGCPLLLARSISALPGTREITMPELADPALLRIMLEHCDESVASLHGSDAEELAPMLAGSPLAAILAGACIQSGMRPRLIRSALQTDDESAWVLRGLASRTAAVLCGLLRLLWGALEPRAQETWRAFACLGDVPVESDLLAGLAGLSALPAAGDLRELGLIEGPVFGPWQMHVAPRMWANASVPPGERQMMCERATYELRAWVSRAAPSEYPAALAHVQAILPELEQARHGELIQSLAADVQELPASQQQARAALCLWRAATQLEGGRTGASTPARARQGTGQAYRHLARFSESPGHLSRALEAFGAALECNPVSVNQHLPAMLHHDLGLTFCDMAHLGEPVANLQRAVASFEQALRMLAPREHPLERATITLDLGLALGELAEHMQPDRNLRRCISATRAALRVPELERSRDLWAAGQHNLGMAHARLAQRRDASINLSRAIAALREALKVRTSDDFPAAHAVTQMALGHACTDLAVERDDSRWFEQAVDAFLAAAQVYTFERAPVQFAACQEGLGIAYVGLAGLHQRERNLMRALAAFRNAKRALDGVGDAERRDGLESTIRRVQEHLGEEPG